MTARNTATRDRDRRTIRRTKPPCGICEHDIDYSLPHTDPMSFTVDHIIPFGPNPSPERVAELDVITNKQAAHRSCNRDKSDKVAEEAGPRTYVTARTW